MQTKRLSAVSEAMMAKRQDSFPISKSEFALLMFEIKVWSCFQRRLAKVTPNQKEVV
jgi:hypothetical protein